MVKKIALKILLCIPFLFIQNVSAESLTDLYFSYSSLNSSFSLGSSPINNKISYNFDIFDNYKIYVDFYTNNLNTFVFYNNSNEYFIINYAFSGANNENNNTLKFNDNRFLSNGNTNVINNIYISYFKNSRKDSPYTFNGIDNFNYVNNWGDNLFVYSKKLSSNDDLTGLSNIFDNYNYLSNKTGRFIYNDITLEFNNHPPQVEPEPDPEEPEEPTFPPYNFKDNKYYVPNYTKGNCVEIIDKDTIRVFEDENTSFYTDYFINSNYISKTGQVDLNYEKQCSTLEFTDIRYYGNDMPQILFILVCILTFTIGFPYVLYKRFRKR